MSKITFSEQQISILNNNPNVKRVSEKSITYTDEFKRVFIESYLIGEKPKDIFLKSGFDIDVIGVKRYEQSAARWIKAYKKDGIIALRDTRTENSGRLSSKPLSKDQIITQQDDRIKLLEEQIELLKKLDVTERRLVNNCVRLSSKEIYQMIHETVLSEEYCGTVSFCCAILGVARSGYYNYLKHISFYEKRELADLEARDQILMAIDFKGYEKGSRSIKMLLENTFGIIYNRKKIQRIMRKYNIKCPIRKANPYRRMAKATKEHRVVANKLKRQFKQGLPGQALLTDITYIKYGNSKTAYLSVIKDNASTDVLAHHTSASLSLDIATTTIDKLIKNHNADLREDVFIHSDQGFHYTSPIFQKLLKDHQIGQSMSRRGNCWDNAPQESFFGHMKDVVDFKSCQSVEEVIAEIDHYIDYYNNDRYQWGLKKMTPKQYRNHLLKESA